MGLFSEERGPVTVVYNATAVQDLNRRLRDESGSGGMGSPILLVNVRPQSELIIRSNVPGNVSFQVIDSTSRAVIADIVSDSQETIALNDDLILSRSWQMREAFFRLDRPRTYVVLGVLGAVGYGLYRAFRR